MLKYLLLKVFKKLVHQSYDRQIKIDSLVCKLAKIALDAILYSFQFQAKLNWEN